MAPSSACVPSVRGLRGGVYASSCACCVGCVRMYRRRHGASVERRIFVLRRGANLYTGPRRLAGLLPRGAFGWHLGQLERQWGNRRHPERFMELLPQRSRRRRHGWLQLAARADALRRRGRSRQSRPCRQRRLLRAARIRRINFHRRGFLYDPARPPGRGGERLFDLLHRRLSGRRHDGLGAGGVQCACLRHSGRQRVEFELPQWMDLRRRLRDDA